MQIGSAGEPTSPETWRGWAIAFWELSRRSQPRQQTRQLTPCRTSLLVHPEIPRLGWCGARIPLPMTPGLREQCLFSFPDDSRLPKLRATKDMLRQRSSESEHLADDAQVSESGHSTE